MLRLSKNEHWALGTVSRGFNLWHVNGRRTAQLKLPPTVRNVFKGPGLSSVILLSARDEYAVAGIRKELYIWAMDSCQLVKVLAAHFQRIIDMLQPSPHDQASTSIGAVVLVMLLIL